MLAFGLVHAVFFSGDIIGAYGLVAVIFAEVIVMTRAWLRVLVGVFIGSLSLLGIWSMAAWVGREPMMLEFHDPVSLDAGYPLVSVASWLIATPMTVLTALVVPCVMIGVGVARWGLLQDPRGRGALLSGIAACGLGIGALGGLPFALMQLDWAFVGSAAWSYPLFHASGVAGACGWLALLALVGGGPREKLGTACAFLSAIGRRSMTAYLSQTLLFILICGLAISYGVRSLGVAVSGLIALVVWALIGLGCAIAEALGSTRGPAEWALRWLVAKSAKKRPMPAFVPVPVVRSDVPAGDAQASSSPAAPVPAPGVEPNGRAQGSACDSE
jgi:putative membrane protein